MIELTATLLIFLFPLAYSPGPGNMFFAAAAARSGFIQTLTANAGYHLATWIVTFLIGIGFGWMATEFPDFLIAIKYAGSIYVLYLAWIFLKAGTLGSTDEARQATFMDGVVLLVLNPKAYVIITLMFSQFMEEQRPDKLILILWITTLFTFNNLMAFCLWAVLGDRLAVAFRQENHARRLNTVFGFILAGVAFWMLMG